MNIMNARKRIMLCAGLAGFLFFLLLYYQELNPWHSWPPPAFMWLAQHIGVRGVLLVNAAIFLVFAALLQYRRPGWSQWISRSIFPAFTMSLVIEMHGIPLSIYLLSALGSQPWTADEPGTGLSHALVTLGVVFSLCGLILILAAWYVLYSAGTVATTGPYRYLRHPQYVGLTLFSFGWILHWPTMIGILMFPLLALAYWFLTEYEERECSVRFPDEYRDYLRATPTVGARIRGALLRKA